ncbi:MAG: outer membrane beta-barrel protein [Candidatus Methylacidiphilales bacterium]
MSYFANKAVCAFMLTVGSGLLSAQESTVVRDTLPSETSAVATQQLLLQEISSEDLKYYGLEEKTRRMLTASLLVSGVYDSNIFISDGNETDDFIWTLAPTITFEPEHIQSSNPHYFKAVYNPKLQFFTYKDTEDTIEHAGLASYLYKGEVVTFNAKHESGTESGPTRDVGTRTNRDVHNSQITLNVDLAEKWSILLDNQQRLAFYTKQNDHHVWTTEGFVLYRPAKNLLLGVGPKLGWTDVTGGPNQDFQQGLARISYAPHPDWSFDLTGGFEVRSFQDPAGVGTRVTPVYQSNITYRVFPQTNLFLSGYRQVRSSTGLNATNFITTGGRVGIGQNITRKLQYIGTYGLEHADYYNTSTTQFSRARDDFFQFTSHDLNYRYNEYLSFGMNYTWMLNDSNVADFVSHRVGLSTTFTY